MFVDIYTKISVEDLREDQYTIVNLEIKKMKDTK